MISIRRILVPTDFSDCATPAVRYAAELANRFGAELILLHVVPDAVLALPSLQVGHQGGAGGRWQPILQLGGRVDRQTAGAEGAEAGGAVTRQAPTGVMP